MKWHPVSQLLKDSMLIIPHATEYMSAHPSYKLQKTVVHSIGSGVGVLLAENAHVASSPQNMSAMRSPGCGSSRDNARRTSTLFTA